MILFLNACCDFARLTRRCVYALVDLTKSPEMVQAREVANEVMGRVYFAPPHLSLVYGDLTREQRVEIIKRRELHMMSEHGQSEAAEEEHRAARSRTRATSNGHAGSPENRADHDDRKGDEPAATGPQSDPSESDEYRGHGMRGWVWPVEELWVMDVTDVKTYNWKPVHKIALA